MGFVFYDAGKGQRTMGMAPMSDPSQDAEALMDMFWAFMNAGEMATKVAEELLESEGQRKQAGLLGQGPLWDSKVATKRVETCKLARKHLFIDFIVPDTWAKHQPS
tara:strand:- start:381 stop:698 length:318 start_codon:yes stop_codon:yes gene_type:complete